MNRRSFLSTLALIPGLGWVKPAEPAVDWPKMEAAAARFGPVCRTAEDFLLLWNAGADTGAIHYGMGREGPAFCGCEQCRRICINTGGVTRALVLAAIER